jgi:hypothetical protein
MAHTHDPVRLERAGKVARVIFTRPEVLNAIEWRICWSGCSQGMFEPAAKAGLAASVALMQAEIAAKEVREGIMDDLPR